MQGEHSVFLESWRNKYRGGVSKVVTSIFIVTGNIYAGEVLVKW